MTDRKVTITNGKPPANSTLHVNSTRITLSLRKSQCNTAPEFSRDGLADTPFFYQLALLIF
jgi:hypothetical protein